MKKMFLLIICLICICGCEKREGTIPVEDKTIKRGQEQIIKDNEPVNTYKDENTFPIGIYTHSNGTLTKLVERKENFVSKKDITTVQAYPANEESLTLNSKLGNEFGLKWQSLDPDHSIKQGFMIGYELNDGTKINQIILGPSTTQTNYDYIEIYLYDAYKHRNDSWYSHIEEWEMNNETYFTSIKLTAGSKVSEIKSKLTLTAFTYDSEDDFDEDGLYRGNSKYSITICDLNKTC